MHWSIKQVPCGVRGYHDWSNYLTFNGKVTLFSAAILPPYIYLTRLSELAQQLLVKNELDEFVIWDRQARLAPLNWHTQTLICNKSGRTYNLSSHHHSCRPPESCYWAPRPTDSLQMRTLFDGSLPLRWFHFHLRQRLWTRFASRLRGQPLWFR